MIEWLTGGNGPGLDWVGLIARALWQGSLILAVVWCFVRLLQGTRPVIRYGLWLLIYIRLLSGFLWVKPLALPLLPDMKKMPVLYYDITASTLPEKAVKTTQAVIGGDFLLSLIQSAGLFLVCLWLSGVFLFSVSLVFQYYRKRSQYKNWKPVSEPIITQCYEELGRRLNLRKMPRLLTADFSGSPFIKGLIHPAIFLPERMISHFQLTEMKLILAHELAHYKRGDLYWNWLPVIVRVLFFFHPVVRFAEREWAEVQEMCCDRLALRVSQASSGVYGEILLRMAIQPQLSFSSQPGVFYLSETKQSLKKRILALKPQPSKHRLLTSFCLLFVMIAMIAPWQLGFCKPFPVCLKLKYKPECIGNLNRPVNVLYILYYVPYPEQENIKQVKLFIDDQFVYIGKWDNHLYAGFYYDGIDYPFKGRREVTIQVITKTDIIQKKYPVSFQKNMEWENF